MDQNSSEINESTNHMETDIKDNVRECEQSELDEMQDYVCDNNAVINNTPSSCDTECLPCSVSSDAPSSDESSENDASFAPAQDLSSDFLKKDEVSNEKNSTVILDTNSKSSSNVQTSCDSANVASVNNSVNKLINESNEVSQNQLVDINKNCQEMLPKINENSECQESPRLQSISSVQHDPINEILESKIASLQNEISDLKVKLKAQEITFKKTESQIRAEFLSSVEKLSRECNVLRKEKEAIVIKYANSEKELILEKKVQQDLEKKIKELNKERESLTMKLKSAIAENGKLTSNIESKMVEIAKLQKENEKLNADFNSREIRIKWLQNKLKTEISSHQETQGKLEHTLQRLNEMREEAKQVRKDCQEMIKCYQEAEEIKSVKLDSQLKQKLTELEVQKQEKSDQEQVYQLLRHELEALKKKQRMTMDENNSLTLKIQNLEKERLEYEQTLSKLKDSQNLLKQEVVDLQARLAEMESLRLQLEREKEKSAASLREVERLRLTNAELQADMDSCHVKEGELLEFTAKLTSKTVHLQSDHCLLEVKAQALEDEVAEAKKNYSELQQKYLQLSMELESTRKEREEEMQLLARKIAEKTKNIERLNTKLDEAENENRVLKRRHIASIKELSRELYQCKRRLESYESNSCLRAESASLDSRTSSTASLDKLSSNGNRTYFNSTSRSVSSCERKPIVNNQNSTPNIPVELDKEVLIERIIKLQKTLAKKNDKIEFLEDHIEQLVNEMRKKAKSVDFKTV